MTPEELNAFKILVRAYYDCVQERVDTDGRMGIKKDRTRKKNTPDRDDHLLIDLIVYREEKVELAKKLLEQIKEIVHAHPLWPFLRSVSGCKESIACVIISEFDIQYEEKKHGRCTTVSNLWSYAGLAPGKDKKVKKKKLTYNAFLRSKLIGVLGSSFLKCQSQPWVKFYYDEKMRLENSDALVKEYPRDGDHVKGVDPKERMVKWCDAYPDHRHKAAIRKMVKEFLKYLYLAWRQVEGLPIREPYSEEYLGKKPHEQVEIPTVVKKNGRKRAAAASPA